MGLTLTRTHAELVRQVLIACNRLPGVFLFPVDVTRVKGWKRTRGMTGTADILGWISMCMFMHCENSVVGCRVVGHKLPRFIAYEIKVGKDRLSLEQTAFLDKVRAAGGIAAEIRCVEDAVTALQ